MKNPVVEKILTMAPQNSWLWITFLFFGQVLCSMVVAQFMHIPSNELFLPILCLFLGGVCALLFFMFNGSAESRRWKWIIPALFYGLFIFLMSNRSFSGSHVSFDTSYFHPIEYVTLGLFLGRFWYWVIDEKGFFPFAMRVIVAGAVFGALDEFHQKFVPGRECDFRDFMLDIAGILTSLLIISIIHYLVFRKPVTKDQLPVK